MTHYWIGNQTTGTVLTASTAANWSTDPSGSPVATSAPSTTDDCIFGNELTLKANKGSAICEWDIAQVQSISIKEGYRYTTNITATDIAFDRAANTLTMSSRTWDELGFRVGMYITISGSAANSGSFYITAITNSTLTINSVTADEAVGPSITVSSESSVDIKTDVILGNTSSGQTALELNGALKNTRGSNSTITFTGIPNSDTRFITNGYFAAIYNQNHLTYDFGSGISSVIYFDDGPYPTVSSAEALTFRSEYHRAPTSDIHGEVTMYALALTNTGVSVTSTRSTVRDDTRKVFRVLNTSTFDYNGNTFDAGFCKWIFKLNATNWPFPISGSTSYGANDGTFKAIWYDVVLQTDTDGFKSTIPQGRALSVNSLKIESGAVLEGYQTTGQSETSVITSVKRPVVEGAWNFSQVADGVYSSVLSDTYLVTPSHGVGGSVQLSDHSGKFTSDAKLTWTSATSTLLVDGKLTVTGLIDPTGMVFTPQATNPETTNPENTIWIDSETGHLVRGERDTESTVHFNVRNDEGATIPLGTPLYSKGEIGGSQRIKVGIADASDPAKMPAIGLAMEEMNTTSTKNGNMIITGILNENITITGVVEQDIIYVAPHGGTAPYLTVTRPTSGSHLVQNVGVCVRQASANVSQGMKVAAIGRTNDIPNGVITTNSADADYVYIDDGNTFKKITPSDLGIGGGGGSYTDAQAIAAVEGTSSLDLAGDLTLDTTKKIIMDEKTYASASASAGTIEITAEETGGNSPLLTLRTPTGYLRMGPQNSSFCHFYTDRDYFYFNKNIQMDGGSFYAYNDDLQIKTDDSGSGQPTRLFIDAGVDACRLGIGNGFSSSNLPATELEVAGTIRQSGATSAVLVADGNGDITAAVNLQDAVYVQSGLGGQEPYAPFNPGNWAGAPPATLEQAIQRLEGAVAGLLGGLIP